MDIVNKRADTRAAPSLSFTSQQKLNNIWCQKSLFWSYSIRSPRKTHYSWYSPSHSRSWLTFRRCAAAKRSSSHMKTILYRFSLSVSEFGESLFVILFLRTTTTTAHIHKRNRWNEWTKVRAATTTRTNEWTSQTKKNRLRRRRICSVGKRIT